MAAVHEAYPSAIAAAAAASASLYVGDLHSDVTEGMLFDAFSEFKSLVSVRLCKDASTGRSLCYGYVNFLSHQDASHAIRQKNHSMLNGKMIRVMWSHRDPDARKSGVGNLFVKNLSESIDNVGLQDMFQQFGNIISCKVATFEEGTSRGFGFVQFEHEESAHAAIEKLNGSTVGDKQIYVGNFVKRSDRILPSPDVKYTNLYMKNLDANITEEVLQEKFSEFGKIVSLAIAKDENGSSKGFAFVNFDNPEDARRAVETMNGTRFGSKTLYVARAQKKAEREQVLRQQYEERRMQQTTKYKGSNVYVKNIDYDVTDEELREHFSQCGTITSAKLMRDDKGISKGFGFVCFSTPEEANKAVQNFHGHTFHRKPLYVSIAQTKEDRQMRLQALYAKRMAALAAASPTTIIRGTYPPIYYTTQPSIFSQVTPPQPGLMYQSLGLAPMWRPPGFTPPSGPAFQASTFPVIPNAPGQTRPNRGRMNGHAVPYAPRMQQSLQQLPLSKEFPNQQRGKYHGRGRGTKKGSFPATNPIATTSKGSSEALSTMLATAPPKQRKQMLGEQLYPLVEKHQPELAGKITGMLLEMDNSELLLLLESPECLAAQVKEAVELLLKASSKKKVAGQDSLRLGHSSSEVAVN